ncbi:gliding-motility protein MglA [bacterium]|nr:gliding-motility protein MglA [bacterium]
MAVIDSSKKEINFKIVYFGPGQTGKTTSLHQLQAALEGKGKGKPKKLEKSEKTLFFDFLALSSGEIAGYKTRFQIYSVPGQILYEDSRKLLLKGVDGIVFVADSQIDKVQENLACLEELRGHLQHMGYQPQEIPMVLNYNKRDLPNIPPIEELRKAVNIFHVPDFETVATSGEGVVDSFKELVKQVLNTLKDVH